MKKILYIVSIAFTFVACNFLDKEPDLRAEINTDKKVQLLLVSAYNLPNLAAIGETMSDNIVDNTTPDEQGVTVKYEPMSQMYDQVFRFEDVTTDSQQDSPYQLWGNLYHNIAVANQALAAIERIATSESPMNAERAEALIVRAYNHFLLVNVFCQAYKNSNLSSSDMGVHYMTAAETTVSPQYDRSNVAEDYANIERDLLEALEYIDDSYYSVPKYHFNKAAAYAFAARFYLFKRDWNKVITYANKVLGSNPAALMWDAEYAKSLGNADNERDCWFDATSPANLLLSNCMSIYDRSFFPSYARYTLNRDPLKMTINGSGPVWDGRFPGFNIWHYGQTYGSFTQKTGEYFEYTDKVAGIGYPRMMTRHFTTGETLLCRAEAEVMLGQIDAAISDMDIWCKGYLCTKTLTAENIESFFSVAKNKSTTEIYQQIVPTLHCNEMAGGKWEGYAENKLPYIWCVLHMRRIENIHDGTRLFDIKRYGIEITHYTGAERTKHVLIWNDDRRAVQLPQEAIIAGQDANKRDLVGPTNKPIASILPEVKNYSLIK